MPSTVQDIIELANSKSMKNKPGVIATASETLEVVVKVQRKLFSFAARVNPAYFGHSDDVALAGGGWPRPATAESVFRLEASGDTMTAVPAAITTGTEIGVVPFEDKRANRLAPSVYSFGQTYKSAGGTLDPASGSITFYYSKVPDDPASVSATLDAMWPTRYDELLAIETALYLAVKDSAGVRGDEISALAAERDEWLKLFVAHLEHETANLQRRWGHFRRFNTDSMIPMSSFFTGGSSLFPTTA